MFIARLIFCWLLLTHSIAHSAANTKSEYKITPTPTWVKTIDYKTTEHSPQQQALDYVLMDDQVNTLQGLQQYRHRVISPLTTVGLEQISELKLSFNPAFEQLHIHQIIIKRDNKARDITNTAKVRVIHREEQLFEGIQDGQATAIVILDDVRVGDIIDYSYSVLGSNPIFANKRFGFLPLDMPLDVGTLSVRLLTDPKKSTEVSLFNNTKVQLRKTTSPTVNEYSVFEQKVSAINAEEATPAWFSAYSWLEYSQYESWADVDQWAQALYNMPIKSTPIFESTYQQLASKSKDKAEFISNALFFVQNEIRYLGLEFGENSHKPHSPSEVLQNRYGDCKDKALLLSKLLQQHGITALPALVSTQFQKGIAQEIPSPGLFNHVITYVEFNGKHYWLDGTRRYQAGSLDKIGTQDFGVALVIGHPSKKLITMYEELSPKTSFEVEEHFYAKDFKGTVDYHITTTLYGNSAESQREYFSNRSPTEVRKAFANFYSHFHDDLSIVKPLEYEDDKINNRFIIREYYQLDNFWQTETNKNKPIFKAPIILTAFSDQISVPQAMIRTSPLALPAPRTISSRIYLHLPSDVKLNFDGKVSSIDNPNLSFNSLDRYYDKTYYNHSELVIKNNMVEAKDFKEFSKDVRETKKQWEYSIFFPTPENNGYTDILKLQNKLENSK